MVWGRSKIRILVPVNYPGTVTPQNLSYNILRIQEEQKMKLLGFETEKYVGQTTDPFLVTIQ